MPSKKKSRRSSSTNGENSAEKKCKSQGFSDASAFMIRQDVSSDDTLKVLSHAWKSKGGQKATLDGNVNFIADPFPCCVVKNFICEKEEKNSALQELISDLDKLDLVEKNNDLYKFKQSTDLFNSDVASISTLKDFLIGQVKPWLSKVTGIDDLNDTVDIFCAKYSHTDHLLCHDDKLEGRKIAYILYLVPEDWSSEDGGALELFSSDNGQPFKVVNSILPSFNSFAFFEVSPVSYHQVAEVLSKSKTRLSVTGWFHGPSHKQEKYTDPKPIAPKDITEQEFFWWINPMYLDPLTQSEIREKFEDSSEISLPDFLISEKYQEMCSALSWIKEQWVRVGPPNKRCYDVLNIPEKGKDDLKPASVDLVRSCVNFLSSDAFCLVLSNMTGLRLHHLAEKDDESQNDNSIVKDASEKDASEKDEDMIMEDVEEEGHIIPELKPEEASNSEWPKEAEEKITQLQTTGVANWHAESEVKVKEDLKSSLAQTKNKSSPGSKTSTTPAKEGKSESGQDDDNWSTASTFGESESKFSVQTDVQSLSSMKTSKSTTVIKKVGIKLDEQQQLQEDERILNSAGPSLSTSVANDDTWSIAATVGENVDPCASIISQVRRWQRSCYSLLYDVDEDSTEAKVASLDARLFFNCPEEWDLKWGGFSSYIAKNEDEELLTAPPVPNTLSLVYREADTFGFVKYVNSILPQQEFHDIALTYVEQSTTDE